MSKLSAAAILASLGAASAFLPAAPVNNAVMKSRSAVQMSVEDELGVTKPLGFWDPLGFCKTDGTDNPAFRRWRAVEHKHGRVAMVAMIGYIVPYFFKFPGYISKANDLKFADVPAGVDALGVVPAAGILQILVFIGFLELWYFQPSADKAPGDVQPESWKRYADDEVRTRKLNVELNNGRLAMFGIMGIMVADKLTDKGFPFAGF
mmetsp:Transcript_6561/g.8881  ORF Transcript_6561/g.8881 Transcript_6561/m.8881 type:complete len:206 (+) Transcript_6561:74-691(+)